MSDLKDRVVEIIQTEPPKEKKEEKKMRLG